MEGKAFREWSVTAGLKYFQEKERRETLGAGGLSLSA